MATKFSIGQSVIAKNSFKATSGKIIAIESPKSENIRYIVDDGVYQTTFKESELKVFSRKPFPPTEDEMTLIKGEYPFLKKGQIEVIYERTSMFVFKFSYSGQVGYGQFMKNVYKKIDEEAYNKWATYVG